MKIAQGSSRWLVLSVVTVLAACGPKGDELYARAEQSLAKGDARAAVIDLKNLVKDDPQNGKARALLAQALVETGDVSAAAIELDKATEFGAPAEAVLVPKCRVMVARGEHTAALEQCSPDAAGGPAKAALQVVQGQALLGLERPGEAKPHFKAALDSSEDNLDALLGLAGATFASDGLQAARGVLDGASDGIRQKAAYWMVMGGIDTQAGDLAAAEQAYQTAVDKADRGDGNQRLMALGALAETQMRQAKVEEARATTEQMAKAAPNNPLVKQLRGQVAAAGGDFEEARTLLEEAVAAMPENWNARILLGVVNLQQNNVGQAEMHFQAVLAAQPQNARAQRLLAETRAKSQSPEKALASVEQAIRGEDADPTMLAMAGRMSLAAGDKQQALQYFSQATSKSGSDQPADVQLEVANGYLMAGDLDKAVELLEKMPSGGATGFERDILLIAALLRKGETDKAIAEVDRLVQARGTDPQVRNLAAGVYAAAGRKEEARQHFAAALKASPTDAATLVNLGRFELMDGKRAEARKHFAKVLEADPKHMLATVGMAAAAGDDAAEAEKWLKKASADHAESVEAQIALAQFYMGTRDFTKAMAVIDAAAKKAPDNAALSNVRGLTMMGLNNVPGAITSFKQATTQAPRAHGYALNLARAHLANRDVDGALAVVNGVLKSEPAHVPTLAFAAATSLQAGRLENATGYVERLRQAAPDAPGTEVIEGDLAMAQKRFKEALAHYRKAGEKGKDTGLVMAEYRAASLAGEAKPERVLEEWIAKNPADANAVSVLAEKRRADGQPDRALQLYEAALVKTPDNVILLNNIANLYDQAGDKRAMDYAERAYKAAPKSPAIADTYGWILFRQGKGAQALPILQEALKSLPDNAEVQYHVAAALAGTGGDKTEAKTLLGKALKGQLPPEARADALKLQQQLGR